MRAAAKGARPSGKAHLDLGGLVVTSGVLYVHSCPPALCPHVEWAVAAELGVRVRLDWTAQPAAPGALRTEVGWRGRPGTAGGVAGGPRGWGGVGHEGSEAPCAAGACCATRSPRSRAPAATGSGTPSPPPSASSAPR